MKKLLYVVLLLALFIIIFEIVDVSFYYELPQFVAIPAIVIFASLFWSFIRRAILFPFEQRNKDFTYDEKAMEPSTLKQKVSKDIAESDIPNLNQSPLSNSHQNVKEKGSIQKPLSVAFVIVTCVSIIACTIWKQHDRKFSSYLYPICENGLYGYIDSVGNKIIEPQFLWCSTFSNGLAMVAVDTIYITMLDSLSYEIGEQDTITKERRLLVKYGYIDKMGNFVIHPTLVTYVRIPDEPLFVHNMNECSTALERHRFRNRHAVFIDTTTWKRGYINTEGTISINPIYYFARPFSDGLAIAYDAVAEPLYVNKVCVYRSKLRCAYIDTTGHAVTEFMYETLTPFSSGRGIGTYTKIGKEPIAVDDTVIELESLSQPKFLLNNHGKVLKELDFMNKYHGFSTDGICVAEDEVMQRLGLGVSFSYIDTTGHYLEPLRGLSEPEGAALLERDDVIGIFDDKIKMKNVTFFRDGLAGASPDGVHWVIIDKYLAAHGYGEESVFENVLGFGNGLCPVKKNGKWGYIDTKIKEVIPCKYDSCGYAYPHLAEAYDLNSDGSIKTAYWINRSDSVVWQSNVCSQIEDTKSKSEWGKWHYRPVVIPSCIYKVYLPIFACIFIILLTLLAQMKHSSQYKVEYKK